VRPTVTYDVSDSNSESTLGSDDEAQIKENMPPEKTEDDLKASVLYKLVKVSKCTGLQ
jgi:hypothetical protein